ncbi:MAG: hypothetical protein HY475_01190, partial [Candidatus Terrybacteria bacterium]|nr:hypothetical protein [Candidatus Terrybacteria bacterium]
MARRSTKKDTAPNTIRELLVAPDRDFSLTVPVGRIPPQAVEAEQSLLG